MQHVTLTNPRGRADWLLLAALLACIPLSFVLPSSLARESGPLENAQVLVLLAGFAAALLVAYRSRPGRAAMLMLAAAPLWLLLAGRELSWGRVLFEGSSLAASGASVVAVFWMRTSLIAGSLVVMGWAGLGAWRLRSGTAVAPGWLRRAPWVCLLALVAGAAGSTCAEGHMGCHVEVAGLHLQVLEELCELIMYSALFIGQTAFLCDATAFVANASASASAGEGARRA